MLLRQIATAVHQSTGASRQQGIAPTVALTYGSPFTGYSSVLARLLISHAQIEDVITQFKLPMSMSPSNNRYICW